MRSNTSPTRCGGTPAIANAELTLSSRRIGATARSVMRQRDVPERRGEP
jgi:hypothetical protein